MSGKSFWTRIGLPNAADFSALLQLCQQQDQRIAQLEADNRQLSEMLHALEMQLTAVADNFAHSQQRNAQDIQQRILEQLAHNQSEVLQGLDAASKNVSTQGEQLATLHKDTHRQLSDQLSALDTHINDLAQEGKHTQEQLKDNACQSIESHLLNGNAELLQRLNAVWELSSVNADLLEALQNDTCQLLNQTAAQQQAEHQQLAGQIHSLDAHLENFTQSHKAAQRQLRADLDQSIGEQLLSSKAALLQKLEFMSSASTNNVEHLESLHNGTCQLLMQHAERQIAANQQLEAHIHALDNHLESLTQANEATQRQLQADLDQSIGEKLVNSKSELLQRLNAVWEVSAANADHLEAIQDDTYQLLNQNAEQQKQAHQQVTEQIHSLDLHMERLGENADSAQKQQMYELSQEITAQLQNVNADLSQALTTLSDTLGAEKKQLASLNKQGKDTYRLVDQSAKNQDELLRILILNALQDDIHTTLSKC